jgi:hypothetical protein
MLRDLSLEFIFILIELFLKSTSVKFNLRKFHRTQVWILKGPLQLLPKTAM